VNAVARADFNHATMIVGVRVHQHSLRMSLREHSVEIGEQLRSVESVAGCGGIEQTLIGLSDADDVDLGTVARLVEKSMDMAVDQAGDRNAQWDGRLSACELRDGEEQRDGE
jgi:hypothetical protein